MQRYYIYIITNKSHTVLYTGVTSNLEQRISQHRSKEFKGFSARYECNKLVYFEECQWIQEAIAREKQIKKGSRKRKEELIISINPNWEELMP